MKNKLAIYSCVFFLIFNFCFSQTFYIDPIYKKNFDLDSLKGFDEQVARASALSEGFYGSEFTVKMFSLKRNYINRKYTLVKPSTHTLDRYLSDNRPAPSPWCLNSDFEASSAGTITSANQISGWVVTKGFNAYSAPSSSNPQYSITAFYPGGFPSNVNSCNMALSCCPIPPMHSELIDCSAPGGYIDNDIGTQYPIYSVFGAGVTNTAASLANPQIAGGMFGNKVLRLNDGIVLDYSIERLSKTFVVTANNTLFQFAFISVFATGHPCCDATTMVLKLSTPGQNTFSSCQGFSVAAPSNACFGGFADIDYRVTGSGVTYTFNSSSSNASNIYNPWKINSVDLTAYIGQIVTVDLVVCDCTGGAHYGKLYFDSQCSPMKIMINNTDLLLSDTLVKYVSCDSLVTLKAPDYFNSYLWSGPGGITSTTSVLTTTAPGTYTLTLLQTLVCSITKTVHISFSQPASIIAFPNILCVGYPAILTAAGLSQCHWNTGDSTQSIYIAPSANTTYTVNGTNSDGCSVSASITQTVTDCTGIKNLNSKNEISLYPNPNNGEFTLNLEKEIIKGELMIETSLGQLVHKQAVLQGKNTIKTKALPNGVYYYIITENKQLISKGKLTIE